MADEKVRKYNELLSWKNLPNKCKKCIYSNICGGGSLPHRYSNESEFNNPTVYCGEMYALIQHAKDVMEKAINDEADNEKKDIFK